MSRNWMWALLVLAVTLGGCRAGAQSIDMGSSSAIEHLNDKPRVAIVPRTVSIDGPGLLMTGKALQSVDARRARVGERVEFELVYDIMQKDGHVAIPKGARIQAVVTEAVSRNREQPESRLGLRLESAKWTNGTAVLSGGVAGIMQVPTTSVKQGSNHPETAPITNEKQIAADNNAWEMQPFSQRDVSPGQTPMGHDEGRDITTPPSFANDQRLLAMEDVSLQRDDRGVAMVSTKKTVKVEKWTYLLLRAESIQ